MSCEILSGVLRNAPAAAGNGNAEDAPVTRSWRDALGETQRSLPPELTECCLFGIKNPSIMFEIPRSHRNCFTRKPFPREPSELFLALTSANSLEQTS